VPRTANKAKAKRPGRKRRAMGWTILALGLLTTAFWLSTGWWRFGRMADLSCLYFHNGRVCHCVRASMKDGDAAVSRWRPKTSPAQAGRTTTCS
jgi:hypothetical protein